MVTINLEKQKKGERYNLFLDGEFYSGIEPDCIVKYSLENGKEFEKEKIEQIILESESFYAFNKALKYLSRSMKTENEIREYLISKQIKKEVVEITINKLYEYNYINDELFVKNYIDFYKEKYGKNKLRQNLSFKKIDDELIEKYLNFDESDNLEIVVNFIKKQLIGKELDLKTKQKIIRNLSAKGYSFDTIKKAFNSLGESDENWD